MSVKVMGRVWDYVLKPSEQAVLLALADHAEHDGTSVRPSVARVAWKTGLSERSVQTVMGRFRDQGVLIRTRKPGYHRPAEYRIVLNSLTPKQPFQASGDKGANAASIPRPTRVQRDRDTGATHNEKGAPAAAPEPSYQSSNESSVQALPEHDDDTEEVRDVAVEIALDVLVQVRDYPFHETVDRHELATVRAERPNVDLTREIDAWIRRGRIGKNLRDQRAALAAWLRKAHDAPPASREIYCVASGCRGRGYGTDRLCMTHRRSTNVVA